MKKSPIKDMLDYPLMDCYAHPRIPTEADTHMTAIDNERYQYLPGSVWLNTADTDADERIFILTGFSGEGDTLRAQWKNILAAQASKDVQ